MAEAHKRNRVTSGYYHSTSDIRKKSRFPLWDFEKSAFRIDNAHPIKQKTFA